MSGTSCSQGRENSTRLIDKLCTGGDQGFLRAVGNGVSGGNVGLNYRLISIKQRRQNVVMTRRMSAKKNVELISK